MSRGFLGKFALGALFAGAMGGSPVFVSGEEGVRLEIDKETSRIAADVKATGHRFKAVVVDYEIELRWDPEQEEIVDARLEFDFRNVKTGRARRDREMLEWLDHDTFPRGEFVLDAVEEDGGELLVRGTLAFHGVEQEIEFPVRIEREGGELRIRAETTVDHRDWDLDEIRAFLFMTVDPELVVEIDLRSEAP